MFQLDVGCYIMSQLTLGSMFCLVLFSAFAIALACIIALIASAATCVMLIFHLLYFMPAYVCLYVIGWLSHDKIYMVPQVILTCKMPSDTPNSITGHVDLLLSGEMSMHEI